MFEKVGRSYPFLLSADKNCSSADTMDGVLGCGATMLSFKPASSMAFDVLEPKAPITVPFCLNFGSLSNKLFTPLGVKKQITSYSVDERISFTSDDAVRYIKASEYSQPLAFSQPVMSLSCWFSEHTYKNFSAPLCLLITSSKLFVVPSAP